MDFRHDTNAESFTFCNWDLYPLVENKEKEKEIKDELISLRNNVALGFFLMNFLFALAIIQLQSNEDLHLCLGHLSYQLIQH
jgi:hypothetical protein